MTRDPRDYWSFVEKIQDATDYVQDLLRENQALERRLANLEREKRDLAEKLGTPRPPARRRRAEDPLPGYLLGHDGVEVAHGLAPSRAAARQTVRPTPVLRAV